MRSERKKYSEIEFNPVMLTEEQTETQAMTRMEVADILKQA